MSAEKIHFIATSHKGWESKPPMPFPETCGAAGAVFPKKDELKLTNGLSLIKGPNTTFFLALENLRQIFEWTGHGMNLHRKLLTADAENRLLEALNFAMPVHTSMSIPVVNGGPISGFTPAPFVVPGGPPLAVPQLDLLPNPLAGNPAPGAALLTSARALQRPLGHDHIDIGPLDVGPGTSISALPHADPVTQNGGI